MDTRRILCSLVHRIIPESTEGCQSTPICGCTVYTVCGFVCIRCSLLDKYIFVDCKEYFLCDVKRININFMVDTWCSELHWGLPDKLAPFILFRRAKSIECYYLTCIAYICIYIYITQTMFEKRWILGVQASAVSILCSVHMKIIRDSFEHRCVAQHIGAWKDNRLWQ